MCVLALIFVRRLSYLFLNWFKFSDNTTSFGNLFQVLTALTLKKLRRFSVREYLVSSFRGWPLVFCRGPCLAGVKNLEESTFSSPFIILKVSIASPLVAYVYLLRM